MSPLTKDIKKALAARANTGKAKQAQAYMKSKMPFHGVAAPEVKKICQSVFPRYPFASQEAWHDAMLDLWREAEFREERYVAQNLAAVRPYRPYQSPKTVIDYVNKNRKRLSPLSKKEALRILLENGQIKSIP